MDVQVEPRQGRWLPLAALIALCACSGCTSITTGAIPAAQLPLHLLAEPHCPRVPIDFTLLRQPPPPGYIVGPRDILGIYIQDILGRRDEPPPVFMLVSPPGSADPPMVVGNPVTVGEDGTIILPRLPPLRVAGLTIGQIDAFDAPSLLRSAPNCCNRVEEQINVTLVRKRMYRVVVVREDAAAVPPILKPRDGTIISRRGSANTIELPSFEGDVLHAAPVRPVVCRRRHAQRRCGCCARKHGQRSRRGGSEQLQSGADPATLVGHGAAAIIRIPLSVEPGCALPFGPAIVIMYSGDQFYTVQSLPRQRVLLCRQA